jgi:hypothetical protein
MATAPTLTTPAPALPQRRPFEPTRAVPFWGRTLLGTFLLLLGLTLIYVLVSLWPALEPVPATGAPKPLSITLFSVDTTIDRSEGLLLVVVFASAAGSFVHAATSFSDFVGNRKLAASWTWWYILRAGIGVSLALLVYFAIRGGLFTGGGNAQATINPYGIAAISGLVGLFSKQATDKLREIFDTMFRVAPGAGDDARDDSAVNPVPVVAGVEPPSLEVGSSMLKLTLHGTGFVPDSVVSVRRADGDGALLEREATYVDPTTLTLKLMEDDVVSAGTLEVTVTNPPPGGGDAGPVPLEVAAPASMTTESTDTDTDGQQ